MSEQVNELYKQINNKKLKIQEIKTNLKNETSNLVKLEHTLCTLLLNNYIKVDINEFEGYFKLQMKVYDKIFKNKKTGYFSAIDCNGKFKDVTQLNKCIDLGLDYNKLSIKCIDDGKYIYDYEGMPYKYNNNWICIYLIWNMHNKI